jgi:hypothetical protein
MILIIAIYVCGFLAVWKEGLLPNSVTLAIFCVSSLALFLIALELYQRTKSGEKEKKNLLIEIDEWLLDENSVKMHTNCQGGSIRTFLEIARGRLLKVFKGKIDKQETIESIYERLRNPQVTYKDVLLQIRYLLVDTTDISQSSLFDLPDFYNSNDKRRGFS